MSITVLLRSILRFGSGFNPQLPKNVKMKPSRKVLIYLILFAIIDTVIPIPITTIILIYVLLEKPDWFEKLVVQIYHS